MRIFQSRTFENKVKKLSSLQYLLLYRMTKSDFELIMIGQHENYYKELKGYLKRRLNMG